MTARIEVRITEAGDAWVAEVTVRDAATTTHRVRVSRADYVRYGDGDVVDLVRRSFTFLLERESNTQVLREFALEAIERYFPEYPGQIRPR